MAIFTSSLVNKEIFRFFLPQVKKLLSLGFLLQEYLIPQFLTIASNVATDNSTELPDVLTSGHILCYVLCWGYRMRSHNFVNFDLTKSILIL